MKKLKILCVILSSILFLFNFFCPVYCATPTTINDVYTVYKNDEYTILDFDVDQTYSREYIIFNDGVQIDYSDIWMYGKSINFQLQDYMDSTSLHIYPMSGQNHSAFYLLMNEYNQQFYFDVDLQFSISEYSNIISNNMSLYILYYDYNYVSLGQDILTYSINENGIYLSEETMVLCPVGTSRILLYFYITLDGDSTSDTRLNSIITLNRFRLQFTNNVANEIFDGLFNDPETEGEANDFNNGMNSTIEQNQANKNQANDFNRPDPGSLKNQFNPYQYIGSNSVALFTDTIAMITQAPIILTMLSVCIGVCAVSYVFFGKKR